MLKRTAALIVVCASLAAAGAARADNEAGLTAEVKFCEKLDRHQPVDPQTSFTCPATKKVYAWTLIKGGKGAFSITHTWYKNGKQVFKHKIGIRGSRYPTWSFMFVSKGAYKVDVADEADQVFATSEFTVN